jgi:MSHA biogenesis protein MshI
MTFLSNLAHTIRPRPSAPSWMGVTTDSARISAAIVHRAGGTKPRLSAFESFDGEQAFEALTSWRRKHGSRSMRTNLLLSPGDYQILPIEAPEVAPPERALATRWRIKDMIDFPAEEACVDCVLIPAAEGSVRAQQALAVVSRRSTISSWMRRSDAAGTTLAAIDIPELAVRNLAALVPTETTCALLHMGLTRTTLVIVWKGELCNSRRFDLHAHQILAASPAEREQLIERLGLDVQRTADAFERQFQAAAMGGLWVTEEHASLSIAEELARFVALQVKPFRLREHLDFDSSAPLIEPERQIDFVMAIGAALRETPS